MDSGNQPEGTKLPEETVAAELTAFDSYLNSMQLYLNPTTMQGKFIALGLVDGATIGGGAAVFLPDHVKMETMLKQVRNHIVLNGPQNFGLLIRALNSVPAYQNLANEIYSKPAPY